MRIATLGLMVLLLGASSTGLVLGQDKENILETKRATAASAATVNFNEELGLGFASLNALGQRIEAARNAMDPVGLASAATELHVAERVSGKTASITSAALMDEAVELAKLRFQADELRAVALLVEDEKVRKDFTDYAAQADKELAVQKQKKELGVRERGITRRLFVDNRTGYTLSIYVNGRYKGSLGPYGDGYVWVGDSRWGSTKLYAKAPGTSSYWSRTVSGNVSDFTWHLYH